MNAVRHIQNQERSVNTSPTEAQKKAGNYRKGHIKGHGLNIAIENPVGSFRRGKDADGKEWKVKMPASYGYIKRTLGADSDHVDCYIGPHLNARKVYVLDQNDANSGKFDEHKCFFGFNSARHVLSTYRKAFSDGKADKRFGHLQEMTPDEFREWLKDGDTTQPIKRAAGGKVDAPVDDTNEPEHVTASRDAVINAHRRIEHMADGGAPDEPYRGDNLGPLSGSPPPPFDPSQPFTPAGAPAFDATKPFTAAPAADKGALNAAGRGAYQGATFNFGDELRGVGEAGGVKPDEWNDPVSMGAGAYKYWTGDKDAEKTYDATVARERETDATAKEQHPFAYGAGEIGGALPAMVALPGGELAAGAKIGSRMLQGAKLGAEYGAISGAGEGTDATSRSVGAGAGVVGGGLGGAAAPVLGAGAGMLYERFGRPVVGAIRGFVNPESEAGRRVFMALEADSADIAAGKANGMTPQQWSAAKVAGEPVTLADLGSARTQSLLRSAANTSPEARGVLEKTINDRFEGQAERVGQDVRNLVNGGANANKTADQLVAEYDQARIPAYKAAFAHPKAQGMWDEDFAQMAQAPAVQQAIRMATVNGRNEAAKLGMPPPVKPFVFAKDGTVQLSDPNFKPNLQFWDVVKKNLDQMGAEGGAWSKVLRGKLDDAVPQYGNARGVAAQFFGERDALEAGRKLAGKRVDPQMVAGLMRKMSPEERDLFREGHASDWAGRVIGNFRDSRDITKAMFNSPSERKMAEVIYGPAGVKKLEARMTLEAVMDGARKALGNSTTAQQLIEAGLAGGALGGYEGYEHYGVLGGLAGGLAGAGTAVATRKSIGNEMAAGAKHLIGKVDARTAARVAELLTSDNPTQLAAGMRMMVSNKRISDGMRGIADRLALAGSGRGPRLHIDTTGWGSAPVRADQDQRQTP